MTDDDWAAEQQRIAAQFYPGTTVLRNHAGITDPDTLHRYEYQLVERRAIELGDLSRPLLPATFDADHLAAIHRHLFGDIYPFAGQIRDYPLSKDGDNFAHYRNIRDYLDAAAYDLRNSPDIRSKDPDRFAHAIADVFAHINTAHPFREGNGRSTRLLIEQAAAEFAHFRIDLRTVTREQWNDASKAAHPQPGRFSPDRHRWCRSSAPHSSTHTLSASSPARPSRRPRVRLPTDCGLTALQLPVWPAARSPAAPAPTRRAPRRPRSPDPGHRTSVATTPADSPVRTSLSAPGLSPQRQGGHRGGDVAQVPVAVREPRCTLCAAGLGVLQFGVRRWRGRWRPVDRRIRRRAQPHRRPAAARDPRHH
ncbi:Probable adenosine monophosphate-protein transferase fic [Tsukamurella paurometabola]|uniref:protein adenylyltransferase n=1 Tax=Tsukamurella paurometabola (strain ATCC 8368 / DSM 20162 / CCUG 35730 / CIP 100753 / JCM 10117 / KCTC 9821 / NBRC 16120 / NCIMB 702349 / NCTC 13040) TaxID=521096 RepID=D5UQP0_TSUPD|nr:filamentation induced by cAMP protein Fic [Tsukamurella paurometabola DSM 20162]SUP42007.1 Probable adenosine monophosphate-protein transferase fic [Tsukamurella paurometabola]